MYEKWNNLRGHLLSSLLTFSLLFGLPVLGFYTANFIFEDCFGCEITSGLFDNHSEHNPCYLLSIDISSKVEAYSVPFISYFLTPISFFTAFYDLLILWFILIVYSTYKMKKENKENSFDKIIYYLAYLFPFLLIVSIFIGITMNKHSNYELRQYKSTPQVTSHSSKKRFPHSC